MLKTVLFASVAVSALCLGPTFGWPTQLLNPLSHEMSIDRISTVSNSPLRILPTHGPSTSSSDEEDGEGSNGARGRRARASTLAIIPFPSASQQATKKRKVNNDDDNDSEDVTGIVTQDVQEPHPFQVILMVDDANQFFSDVLDLKSYLALASTNKNVHVRKVITDKIMSKDLRGLHRIQWQGGPQVKTFLNYLFNRTVWEAQREVLRAVHYMNDESESDEFADLARLVKRLDDPCLDGFQLKGQPRLQPSVRESVQPIKRIFDDLYGLMEDAPKAESPFDFGLTVYKHMTPLTGKNLMDKNGGERQMAFFLEHLIRWNQARLNNQLQVVPVDFKES